MFLFNKCFVLHYLDNFEALRFKEKMLAEKVGTQTQTSRKHPLDLFYRRIVLGPKLYFKADWNTGQ